MAIARSIHMLVKVQKRTGFKEAPTLWQTLKLNKPLTVQVCCGTVLTGGSTQPLCIEQGIIPTLKRQKQLTGVYGDPYQKMSPLAGTFLAEHIAQSTL